MQYFALNGITAAIVPLPTMEANKDFELVFELARQMEHFKLNRFAPRFPSSLAFHVELEQRLPLCAPVLRLLVLAEP